MSTWSQRMTWLVPVLVVLLGGGGLLLAVFGLPGGGEDRPAPRKGDEETSLVRVARGEVRGTVLADGKPVPGVRVALFAGEVATQPEVSAVSDGTGRFRLVGAQPGREYLLETSGGSAGGSRQGVEWAPVEAVPLTLTAEAGLGGVELAVSPTNEVTGRLMLGDDEPLAGIDVIAYRRSSDARLAMGAARREEWSRAETDEEGRFVLPGLPDGEWLVRANETFDFFSGPNMVGTQARQAASVLQEAVLDTFERIRTPAEGAVKLSGGTSVDVGDLVTTRGRVLVGVVTDADGKPVAGASVQVRVKRPELVPVRETTTDENGRYRFIRLKKRTFWVSATGPDGSTGEHRAAKGAAPVVPEGVIVGDPDVEGTPVTVVGGQFRTRADVQLTSAD